MRKNADEQGGSFNEGSFELFQEGSLARFKLLKDFLILGCGIKKEPAFLERQALCVCEGYLRIGIEYPVEPDVFRGVPCDRHRLLRKHGTDP